MRLILFLFIVVGLFSGCSSKKKVDRARSFYKKEDFRVDKKRILKSIDLEIQSILELNKKEEESIDIRNGYEE